MYSGYPSSSHGALPTSPVYPAQQQQQYYSPSQSSSTYTPSQSPTSAHSSAYKSPRPLTFDSDSDELWRYINDDVSGTTIKKFNNPNTVPEIVGGPRTARMPDSYNGSYIKAGQSAASSPYSSPASSTSSQTVTFTSCPRCNTVEHHFFQPSRTCTRCGHTRYFSQSQSDMSQAKSQPATRTYWRPTRYTTSISYAHIKEGREDSDSPIHEALATWAVYQRQFILAMAMSVSQLAQDITSCPAFDLELSNTPGQLGGGGGGSASMASLTVVNQSMTTFEVLQADDLLGSFKVLQEEHASRRSRGQKGIVIAVLNCRGASLALACRLDDQTM